MSTTLQRDQVASLAKSDPKAALKRARKIDDPWFRAQALSWVARFTDADPPAVALQAAKAASACDDDYKRSAVRAWEIAALAERDHLPEAEKILKAAVALAKSVQPVSSRAEALLLLLQAAFSISSASAAMVCTALEASCPAEHWRSKRVLRDARKLLDGQLEPRPFFW
jgi:hypothetical protein